MARGRPARLGLIVTAAIAFFPARWAFADVATQQPTLRVPKLEVVVQSGVRGGVNHCPKSDAGKQSDNPTCFFDWDAPLANLKVNLPLKANSKCVPAKEKLAEGLDLELGCASLVVGKGPRKESKAYKFRVTLHDAAPEPRVVTVTLEPGALWKFGGLKDRQRDTKPDAGPGPDGGSAAKPKRTLLVQLKLAE